MPAVKDNVPSPIGNSTFCFKMIEPLLPNNSPIPNPTNIIPAANITNPNQTCGFIKNFVLKSITPNPNAIFVTSRYSTPSTIFIHILLKLILSNSIMMPNNARVHARQ